ncbi:M23 family metallopeptidase [Celeribacter indicus]|uniref:Peptidase, M23 family protein n=1 Tax=Celeribacter indicus TaxID=1208324 RepID=A0A0B5DZE0_9RHOB|nr:M23 family metallopeptidase [Celeribacter indicus]AJE48369.1 peptidase, M23 family protein [Celeribacter indicus]SDW74051.1 Peptidase family M23 [Celeribacter indicus]
MRRASLLPLLVLAAPILAAPALARDPVLSLPLDCTPGESCYIQNYVDTDPGPGAADFTCGPLSYDGHKGTDFALPAMGDVWTGVDVFATAPGTVRAIRDGEEDVSQGNGDAPDVTGKECGNGVVIDHGGGWTSQYCHLRKGSVAVRTGQRVGAATVLGQVGLSGATEFPHLHFVLRRDGAVIDPFNPGGVVACGEGPPRGGTLWSQEISYRPGGLLSVGIATRIPAFDQVKAGTAAATALTTAAPALVVYGFAYGSRAGDVLRLSLAGPEGEIVSRDAPLDTPQAQVFRAVGKASPGTWHPGGYRASVALLRDGRVIDRMTADMLVDDAR